MAWDVASQGKGRQKSHLIADGLDPDRARFPRGPMARICVRRSAKIFSGIRQWHSPQMEA